MEQPVIFVLVVGAYKLACLFAGLGFGWLGYRLFRLGIWGNAGEMSAHYKDNKLLLKSAAPGTFFAVLGAVALVFTIVQGFDVNIPFGVLNALNVGSGPLT